MYEIDEQLGVDPLAPSRVIELGPPAPPPLPLQFEPPPWSSHYQPPARPVREPDPPPVVEDQQATPARPTPRLNKARRWQLVPDENRAA